MRGKIRELRLGTYASEMPVCCDFTIPLITSASRRLKTVLDVFSRIAEGSMALTKPDSSSLAFGYPLQ